MGKNQIYKKSLFEVGIEMGQKLSHNLIPRPELLEWLRRTRTALRRDNLKEDINIIKNGFIKEYGRQGEEVFESMIKEIK